MRRLISNLAFCCLMVASCVDLGATTLRKLELPELVRSSTAIVQGKVSGIKGLRRGQDVFTVYQVLVQETWKREAQPVTPAGNSREVAVPGGVADGIRQMVDGVPQLENGQEYVLFLWTGKSGLTQLTGLGQGVFRLERNGTAGAMVRRAAVTDVMLDAQGRPAKDAPVAMKLGEFRAQVNSALLAAKPAAEKFSRTEKSSRKDQ
jgi:hypothetical protein